MLTIRFLRTGKKNQPFFKIVIVDKKRSSKAGRFIEQVGFYNPLKKEKALKAERIKYWISVGAQPSDTVYNLLISEKIVEGKKTSVHKKAKKKEEKPKAEKKPKAEEKPKTKEKPKAEEKPKEEEKPKAEVSKKEEV